jgi:putative transposase
MLTDVELKGWFHRLCMSDQAQAVIRQVRSSDPARCVGGGRRNVSGRYPSRKMGVTIQFESHRVELAEVYVMEHDPNCLEYYDQPPPIKLEYRALSGKQLGVLHTADYFAIRTGGAGWIECKTEQDLGRLSEEAPNRYRFDGSYWRCPPGEAYAAQLGLDYTVRSSRDINWAFQSNMQFLEDYFRGTVCVASVTAEKVRAHVAALPGITLEDLLARVEAFCSRDEVYFLIAQGRLCVDLCSARLTEPGAVKVFASADLVKAPAQTPHASPMLPSAESVLGAGAITWNGRPWKVVNVSADMVSLLKDDLTVLELPRPALEQLVRERSITGASATQTNSEPLQRILKANEEELRRANQRYECVCRFLRGEKEGLLVPLRTLRRWTARYREAERCLGSGFLGLFSDMAQRGNSRSKLPDATTSLMAEFIESDYETLKQKNKRTSWMALRLECEKRSITPPSYKTFSCAIGKRSGFEQTLKRRGHRAAYEQEPFYWELELKTPRHGVRPFEIGHIDHTQLDIELVCSLTGRVLGRPWLTILTDAFSRRFLAFYLTFDAPSFRSCMMVLRECVYRHSRLPQIIVVDGGSEFGSTYFETLLARYQCMKKTRPPAKARFGSVCERLFGTANTQFIHNLRGNTQMTQHVRQVTKGVDPKGQAVWPLKELQEQLARYFYEVYDSMDHPALGQSPREAYQSGFAVSGERAHRVIPYDREFLIYTLPTTARRTAKILPGRGIKVNYLYYWCESFRNAQLGALRVEVRYDPFDLGTIHAFVDNQWVECHSEYYHAFQGRSHKEVKLAAQELRKRWQNHSSGFPVTARRLAELLAATETQETVLAQRLLDMEVRRAQSGSPPCTMVIPGRSAHIPAGTLDQDGASAPEPRQLYGEL